MIVEGVSYSRFVFRFVVWGHRRQRTIWAPAYPYACESFHRAYGDCVKPASNVRVA